MPGYNNWLRLDPTSNEKIIFDMTNLNSSLNRKEAIDFNVQKICERYDNLFLTLSGGLDSEFAAKCLYDRNIQFTPIIVDYVTNANEVWWAYKWCRDHSVVPHVLKYDDKFEFTLLCKNISEKYGILFIDSIAVIVEELVNKLNGHMIGPCPQPFTRKFSFEDKLADKTSDNLLIWNSYMVQHLMKDNDPKHPYSFITYTPELLFNCIKTLDYNKPPQLALAEYYGVQPRPKISAQSNLALMGSEYINAINIINRKNAIYKINMGDKESFLRESERKSLISSYLELISI